MAERYSRRIVAFIDILGFKDKTEKAVDSNEIFNQIRNALDKIVGLSSENQKRIDEGYNYRDINVTTFSDSAVISYPAEKDNLFFLLLDIIHLQIDLIYDGILLRGGISIGDLIHNKEMVYGPAMNRAYELESQLAVTPRIIVDFKAIEQYFRDVESQYDIEDIMGLLNEDNDGLVFIDILKQESEMSDFGDEYFEWLKRVRELILEGITNENEKVRIKYHWLKTYYNEIITGEHTIFPVPQDMSREEQIEFRRMYDYLRIE